MGFAESVKTCLIPLLAVLMLWWLTRPGDETDNAYGRPPR